MTIYIQYTISYNVGSSAIASFVKLLSSYEYHVLWIYRYTFLNYFSPSAYGIHMCRYLLQIPCWMLTSLSHVPSYAHRKHAALVKWRVWQFDFIIVNFSHWRPQARRNNCCPGVAAAQNFQQSSLGSLSAASISAFGISLSTYPGHLAAPKWWE